MSRFRGPPYARLLAVPEGLAFESSYDVRLKDALKAEIPATHRTWQSYPTPKPDGCRGAWVVAPQYGAAVADLAEIYIGIRPAVPQVVHGKGSPEVKTYKVMYVGKAKEREDGSVSAFGQDETGSWNLVFPLKALKAWFEPGNASPDRPQTSTYYTVLGVAQTATSEEIRKAYRTLARQWHPDVCREADATEVFKAIGHAYGVLSNPDMRRKYNAGLHFQAEAERLNPTSKPKKSDPWDDKEYQPKRRCGWVMAKGTMTVGRFIVSEILGWEDISNDKGETLVTSWQMGAKTYTEVWV